MPPDDDCPAPDEPDEPGCVVGGAVVAGAVVGGGAVVAGAVVCGGAVVAGAVVCGGAVVAGAVVGGCVVGGAVVDAGEAWAWAGAVIEVMIGFVQLLGRMRAVATPPMMTFRTCLRSCWFRSIDGNPLQFFDRTGRYVFPQSTQR